jgi:hypothetical protein
MTEVLDIIDRAIKRLVAPAAMIVAAELLYRGAQNSEAEEWWVILNIWLLGIWAIGYMVMSAKEAMTSFDNANIGKFKNLFLSTSFMLVYIVLAFAAIRLGFDKIT